jgi:hypothetical protein
MQSLNLMLWEMLVTSVVGVGMLDAAADEEPVPPTAPQMKGVGPGMGYVVSVV